VPSTQPFARVYQSHAARCAAWRLAVGIFGAGVVKDSMKAASPTGAFELTAFACRLPWLAEVVRAKGVG
jgi:hypothetical protein